MLFLQSLHVYHLWTFLNGFIHLFVYLFRCSHSSFSFVLVILPEAVVVAGFTLTALCSTTALPIFLFAAATRSDIEVIYYGIFGWSKSLLNPKSVALTFLTFYWTLIIRLSDYQISSFSPPKVLSSCRMAYSEL